MLITLKMSQNNKYEPPLDKLSQFNGFNEQKFSHLFFALLQNKVKNALHRFTSLTKYVLCNSTYLGEKICFCFFAQNSVLLDARKKVVPKLNLKKLFTV
jgi:hypothetical protein